MKVPDVCDRSGAESCVAVILSESRVGYRPCTVSALSNPPTVLSIAGSDSSGGAGLQADIRTLGALGVHCACAVTLVSAQNTAEFRSVVPMPPGMVLSQVEAVLDDLPVSATKTGLLFTGANVAAIATVAESGRLPSLVVDPVMVGMQGKSLYDSETERLIADRLVKVARVLTPNHLEAALLLGHRVDDDDASLVEAAEELAAMGPEAVVVTGGRRSGSSSSDVLVVAGEVTVLRSPRIETPNVRGSGDTLSAAIAGGLARGVSLASAVREAHEFTIGAIGRAASWRLGAGQGPLDQFGWAARNLD